MHSRNVWGFSSWSPREALPLSAALECPFRHSSMQSLPSLYAPTSVCAVWTLLCVEGFLRSAQGHTEGRVTSVYVAVRSRCEEAGWNWTLCFECLMRASQAHRNNAYLLHLASAFFPDVVRNQFSVERWKYKAQQSQKLKYAGSQITQEKMLHKQWWRERDILKSYLPH